MRRKPLGLKTEFKPDEAKGYLVGRIDDKFVVIKPSTARNNFIDFIILSLKEDHLFIDRIAHCTTLQKFVSLVTPTYQKFAYFSPLTAITMGNIKAALGMGD